MPVTLVLLALVGAAAAATGSVVVFGVLLLLSGSVLLGHRRRKAGLALALVGALCIAPFATAELLGLVFALAVPTYALGFLIGYWRAPGETRGSRRGVRV